ncbi:basic proline-rich protein-like [Motacilla alba alba]|uniref:basic proline-rich protein-like n=1 Tax=Motacilla alba alba TaxID=1094192 RepID=UPI0018D57CAB|nr:basic proline-rich protein-like [Motacilla alba alba]
MSRESGGGKSPSEQAGLALCSAGLSRRARPTGTRGSAVARGRSGTHRQGPGPPERLPHGVRTAAGSGTPLHRGDAQPRLTHRLPQRRPGSRHPHTRPPVTPAPPSPGPGRPHLPLPPPPPPPPPRSPPPSKMAPPPGGRCGALWPAPAALRGRAPPPRPAAGQPPCLLRAGPAAGGARGGGRVRCGQGCAVPAAGVLPAGRWDPRGGAQTDAARHCAVRAPRHGDKLYCPFPRPRLGTFPVSPPPL